MQLDRMILGTLVLLTTGAFGFAAGRTTSQEVTTFQPGKEHAWLEALTGDYTTKTSGMLGESEGTATTETVLGGLWSMSRLEGTLMGQPFKGLEILGFDPLEMKYVSIWIDSTTPLITSLKGTYDAESETLTMTGPSRGMDGEVGTMVNTTKLGERGRSFVMNIDGMELMTIDYTRKE